MDRTAEELLRNALTRPQALMVSERFMRESEAFMAEYRAVANALLAVCTERKSSLPKRNCLDVRTQSEVKETCSIRDVCFQPKGPAA